MTSLELKKKDPELLICPLGTVSNPGAAYPWVWISPDVLNKLPASGSMMVDFQKRKLPDGTTVLELRWLSAEMPEESSESALDSLAEEFA